MEIKLGVNINLNDNISDLNIRNYTYLIGHMRYCHLDWCSTLAMLDMIISFLNVHSSNMLLKAQCSYRAR